MESIQNDVNSLKSWQGVANHRFEVIERQHQDAVKQATRLETEVNHVDKRVTNVDIKVSRIEGGIDFLKWAIPISIGVATTLGSIIVWVVTNAGG